MTDLDLLLARHAETPDDEVLMGAIADWLDEHHPDQHALAELYRGGARAWLTAMAAESGGHGYDDDDYREITYLDLVRAGADYLDHGDYLTQWGREDLYGRMYDGDAEMFWRCWEVVTGRRVPPDKRDDSPFSCSC